jgi:DtxR family transcriptional regulator, Mn-dependent transcriptional regulator
MLLPFWLFIQRIEDKMAVRKSYEDYLETMLMLQEEHGYIRSVDIANHMGVTKPSVTYATRKLKELHYITMNEIGLIQLTDEGKEIADSVYGRHKTISRFLEMLGVNPETAQEDACKLEHDVSNESYAALCRHMNGFMANCPVISGKEKCPESGESHKPAEDGNSGEKVK